LFLADIISPMQIAFVPGPKGIDNAIIIQELLHTMSKKKGKSRCMALKIDLEKAFDRLEWSFIRDTLHLFKIPDYLVNFIMSCISSSSISIHFNKRCS
jgi:hypothetical protein